MAAVTFLNHSSILVNSGNTKILCDPWFNGLAFHDGWSLLVDNLYDLNEIDFDYIWISHEHPDHFSIPTLRSLKKSAKFLYQKTKDQKVKKYLESKGHLVIELINKTPTVIGDIEITSILCHGFDCSLLFRFQDNSTFLNINDARIDVKKHLETDIAKFINSNELDLVSTQFSYANWAGNPGDKKMPEYFQSLVDQKNKYIIEFLKPKACLLFASFVYYCHEENFYCNENSFYKHVLQELNYSYTKLILPIPDQTINLLELNNENFDDLNSKSYIFWNSYHNNVSVKRKTESIVNIDKLVNQYESFHRNLWLNNDLNIKSSSNFTIKVFLDDIDTSVEIGLFQSKFEILESRSEIDFSISTETLDFLLKNNFGRGTVLVNSRIKFNYKFAHRFFLFFFIPYQNNIGIYFNNNDTFSKIDLINVQEAFVLNSIFKLYPEFKKQFILDCDSYSNLLEVN
jgi:UDP-MurNAc hydroxylase